MVKILNLDELDVDSGRAIVVNGTEHEMKLFSAGDFIKSLKAADKATKEGTGDNIEEVFSQMVNMIDNAFPTLPRTEIEDLSMPKISAIFEFVQATEESDTEEAKATGGKSPKKSSNKKAG